MTQTINITQSILDTLSSGEHTLTVKAVSEKGAIGSDSTTFVLESQPILTVAASQGIHQSEFSFDITLSKINDFAMVYGIIDGSNFYQLNYAKDGKYSVTVSTNLLNTISGGLHTITFTLTDNKGYTATGTTTFTKTYNVPVVAMASNLGDRNTTFAVAYAIKNVNIEKPSLNAYMDTENASNLIYSTSDASQANSFTVDAITFSGLSVGSHTIITVVTNSAGKTTKHTSFNKVSSSLTSNGLKLGYTDDTWNDSDCPNRIYTEDTATYDGNTYKTFVDSTPYITEGETVNGSMLAALSRNIQNAAASNVAINSDGSLTETGANGTSTITETSTGYVEVYTDKENNTLTKTVSFNDDGSVAESITFTKGA